MGSVANLIGGLIIFGFLALLMAKPIQVTAVDQEDTFGLCKQEGVSLSNCTVKLEAPMSFMEASTGEGIMYQGERNFEGLRSNTVTKKQMCSWANIKCSVEIADMIYWADFTDNRYNLTVMRNGKVVNNSSH